MEVDFQSKCKCNIFLLNYHTILTFSYVIKYILVEENEVRDVFICPWTVRDSVPYRPPLYPPCAGHVIWRPCAFGSMCERFACSVAFYFIDVDVLIRPGDAQKYVSRRSFVLFSFVTLYLFRVRVASFLYIVIFSCTDQRKDV